METTLYMVCNDMRVLLVQQYTKGEPIVYPLGLGILAGALRKYDVSIFDPNISSDPEEDYQKILNLLGPDVIGFSLRNVRFYSERYKKRILYEEGLRPFLDLIKHQKRKVIIVVGGTAFSMFPRKILEMCPEIDFGVYLEGEETFPDLLDHLDTPEKVQGIYYRKDGNIHFSGVRNVVEKFPAVGWEKLPPTSYASDLEGVGLLSKRGCLLHCLYCNYPFLSGNDVRLRAPGEVVDEIEHLYKRYGIKQFAFADTVFNVPKGLADAICVEIIKRNIPVRWTAFFDEEKFDREFMNLALDAGCVLFQFSPDAYSDRCLKKLRKNISTRHIINTYHLIRSDNRAKASYNFMIGVPDENFWDLIRMMLFSLRCKLFLKNQLGKLAFTRLRIEPNTGLEKYAREQGIISEYTNLLEPTFYPSVLRRSKFFKFLKFGFIKKKRRIV